MVTAKGTKKNAAGILYGICEPSHASFWLLYGSIICQYPFMMWGTA